MFWELFSTTNIHCFGPVDGRYAHSVPKIFEEITIADGCAIGDNAIVTKFFRMPARSSLACRPKKAGENDSRGILINPTEILKARGWKHPDD